MQCMQAVQLQPTLHIIPDKEIISRHLAADDVKPLIIRAADNTSFQYVMLRQIKVVNFHTDVDAFMGSKEVVMCQERKAVCTQVIQFNFDGCRSIGKCDRAGIGDVQTRVFPAAVNLRTGFNLNREVGSRFLRGMDNLSRIPAVKHVADSYLQLTFCHLRKLRCILQG